MWMHTDVLVPSAAGVAVGVVVAAAAAGVVVAAGSTGFTGMTAAPVEARATAVAALTFTTDSDLEYKVRDRSINIASRCCCWR